MTFHRFVTPTYFGGLPAGYDLINVTSGGTGAGGSAFADGPKGGGNPNTGTYFVAWGEDATSSNANRGLRALAENTDALDNLFRRDLAAMVRTNDATAGAPVASVVLPTSTFLGTVGYTTSTADLARLFSILDGNDDEIIIQSTGQKVQVTSVTLGAGDQIGGGGANGSFSGGTVQINISPSIPTGTTYKIWYGTRTNLATLPVDAFTTAKIRGVEEVPSEVENLFRLLHGNNLSWNASWTSTVWDLAASGLNERYNRSTTAVPSGAPEAIWASALNTNGAGGWIYRTGPALTVYSGGDDAGLSDPLNALFVAKNIDSLPSDSGGVVGFASFGARRSSTANAAETVQNFTPGGAHFLGLWPHDFGAVSAADFYTKVTAGSACTLSLVGAYNLDTGEAIVQLSGTDHFQTGGNSAVALGYDLLEVTYLKSAVTHYETFVIVGLGSSSDPTSTTKCRVRRMNGTVPDFTASTGIAVRWVSTGFAVGDGGGRYHKYKNSYADNISVLLDGLYHQVPPSLSNQPGDNDVLRVAASFSAQDNTSATRALRWGGFSPTAFGPVWTSWLTGDGGASFGAPVVFNSWPLVSSQTVKRHALNIYATTSISGGPDASQKMGSLNAPAIVTVQSTSASAKTRIRLTDLVNGAAVTSVKMVSTGLTGGGGTFTPQNYQVVSLNPATGVETALSAVVDDAKNTVILWNAQTGPTVIPLTGGGFTVNLDLVYEVIVGHAAAVSGGGASGEVNDAETTMAITAVRF